MTEARRERERHRIRKSFLDAARVLLVTRGYDALTMRKVAQAAEYSAAAIYTHFADKDALVRELCKHDFAVFSESLVTVLSIEDPRERLAALADAYVAFGTEHPEHYRLLFLSAPAGSAKGHDESGTPETDAYATLEVTVKYAMSRGMFSALKDNHQLVAQTLWAAVHGIVGLQLSFGEHDSIKLGPLGPRLALMREVLLGGLEHAAPPPVPAARRASKKTTVRASKKTTVRATKKTTVRATKKTTVRASKKTTVRATKKTTPRASTR